MIQILFQGPEPDRDGGFGISQEESFERQIEHSLPLQGDIRMAVSKSRKEINIWALIPQLSSPDFLAAAPCALLSSGKKLSQRELYPFRNCSRGTTCGDDDGLLYLYISPLFVGKNIVINTASTTRRFTQIILLTAVTARVSHLTMVPQETKESNPLSVDVWKVV
ncbi:hypothetical protein BDR03DRAFT_1000502 [Suillus americanus]|nr:hypothetical protein BDR03DRAFT_1000502 [Suillus americanus]